MGTHIEYVSLYGNADSGPVCGLLKIDGVNLLLDCGWDDDYDVELLNPIKEVLDTIDAVLISHPDPSHLGALPYLVGKLKLQVPVYGTVACHKMGQLFMYDQVLSRKQSSDFEVFSLDDIDAAFSLMRQLKYQQRAKLTGKAEGMSVTGLAAGHLIGGAIWQVSTTSEEQIVYAVGWNHSKDRHLRRADLVGRFSRPAVLITDACSALRPQVDHQKRNATFLDQITRTLQSNGSVLIPSDTAGRVLEVLLTLESHWNRSQLRYTIVLLTPVASSMLEFAKSQLEWMNQEISEQFSRSKLNPFDFRHVKVCRSREELYQLPGGPKVILASLPSLRGGLSRQLFVDWAPNPANLILFTSEQMEGSIAHQVQQKREEALPIQMQIGRRVELEGEELKAWQEQQKAQLLETEPMLVDKSMEDLEDELQGNSPMAEDELPLRGSLGARASLASQPSARLVAPELAKPKTRETLIEGFDVPEGAAAPMFPFPEEEDREWTDYGLSLKPGDFRKKREELGTAEVESDEEMVEELPTRVVTSEVVVNVRATVNTFSFDGLTDQHSILTLLTKVAPRHLIVAFGSPQSRQALTERCFKETEVGWGVHSATSGSPVDVSSGSSSYRVTLSDKLLESLKFRKMGNYKLAWLNARIHESVLDDRETRELVPDAEMQAHKQEGGIFVGDVRLSSLRKALGQRGISADFQSGMLVCQSQVIIKPRSHPGQLTLEGPISNDYYTIRDILYSQYHIC